MQYTINVEAHDGNMLDNGNFSTFKQLTPINNGSLSEGNLKYTSASLGW